MVQAEEIWATIVDFYWGGSNVAFALKIAITIIILGILLRGIWPNKMKQEAKKLFTSFKLNNSEYKREAATCYDEGWERMKELRGKIKDARDPWKKHDELILLQKDAHKCLTEMNREGEQLQRAYKDMYAEYINITKDIQELERTLPRKKEEEGDFFGK